MIVLLFITVRLEGEGPSRDYLRHVLSQKRMTNEKDREPVLDAALSFRLQSNVQADQVYYRGRFFDTQGDLDKAMSCFMLALVFYDEQHNEGAVMRALGDLSTALKGKGHLEAALALQRVALKKTVQLYGEFD